MTFPIHIIKQHKNLWLPAFMVLLFAVLTVPKANAGLYRPQMIFVQPAAQAADTDGDGRLDEIFSAAYTVYDDGTAEGYIYLDSDYRIEVESGSIDMDENGVLTVIARGTNLEHELGHALGFRHEHNSPTGGGGGTGGDIVVFDIVDAATGQSTTFEAMTDLTIR